MKTNEGYNFGEKIRSVRERRGITLKGLAEKIGVSESLVSQIERNRVSPSLDTLLTMVDALSIDLDWLFKDFKKNKSVNVVRANERTITVTGGVVFNRLSTIQDASEEHSIEAYFLEVPPGSEKGSLEYGHIGKELGVILSGKGEFHYGTQVIGLGTGDSISFASDIPHRLKNVGEDVLKAFWVVTPPRILE
jgi:transcriptional regulator with XRE-family HTH domain